jgi:hypothetical protein
MNAAGEAAVAPRGLPVAILAVGTPIALMILGLIEIGTRT